MNNQPITKLTFANRTSWYETIGKTNFFNKMDHIPHDSEEMILFVVTYNGHILFNFNDLERAARFYWATTVQLDAFFILFRCVDHYYNQLLKLMETTMQESINIFSDPVPELVVISQNPLFFHSISERILDDIDYDFNLSEFMISVTTCLENLFKHTKIVKPYGDDKLDNSFQLAIVTYLQSHNTETNAFFKKLYDKLSVELSKILPIGKLIIDLCSRKINAQENLVLENFIKENLFLEPNYKTDLVLVDYYTSVAEYINDIIQESSQHDNSDIYSLGYNELLKEYENDNVINYSQKTNQFHNATSSENMVISANLKLSKIGYQIVKPTINSWMHGLDNCFIQQGLASNTKEIASFVYYIMSTERNTPGYTNKYDTMTLYDHFMLVSIANDVQTSYDLFMAMILKAETIPFEYPTEILLRILSRICNVNIVFYSNRLTCITIDNASETNANTIDIFQYTPDIFFNIIPIGSEFYETGIHYQKLDLSTINTHTITTQTNMNELIHTTILTNINDLNDIVEI